MNYTCLIHNNIYYNEIRVGGLVKLVDKNRFFDIGHDETSSG